jgi:hypothetical protein
MTVGGVLREAWRLYVILFWRSLLIAAPIFVVLVLPGAAFDSLDDTSWTVLSASVLVLLFTSYGDFLVEGLLAEDVRDVYEERPTPALGELARRMRPRLLPLAVATLVYSVCFAVGMVLLVVPGLIVLTRWSVIVPVIVIEGRGMRESFRRSSRLVKGSGWTVLGVLAVVLVVSGLLETLFDNLLFSLPEFFGSWLGHFLVSALTAPFAAHALAVIYYRLVDLTPPRSS